MSKKRKSTSCGGDIKYVVSRGARMNDDGDSEDLENFNLTGPRLEFKSLESVMVHFREIDENGSPFLLFPSTGKGWNVIIVQGGMRILYLVESK